MRFFCVCAMLVLSAAFACGQEITPKQLLDGYQPRQSGIPAETPAADEIEKCRREVVREGKGSSWVVYGPAGQVLRRFTDTDGDGKVDQFRYYNLGIEIYRDIDSDGDEKIDQYRWLNTGGTAWGLDPNEDGRIDEWKIISPHEAARMAVEAIIGGDADLLATVLLTTKDIQALGLKGEFAERAAVAVQDPEKRMKAARKGSNVFSRNSKWLRFDTQTPGMIPAGRVSDRDLMVMENSMAMVDVDGKPGLIHVGELVRVGDAWKLVGLPAPAEGDQIPSLTVLMQPELENAAAAAPGAPSSPEMQQLLDELQKLDKASPSPTDGARAIGRYNQKRAQIIAQLAEAAPTMSARDEWTRQLADGVAAAVQAGDWADGMKLLKDLEASIRADPQRSQSEVLPYVIYRRLLAEYAMRLKTDDVEQRQEAQEWWLKQLPEFARAYPSALDAADALIELAKNQEFVGKIDEAEKWYQQVARQHPQTPAGKLAQGALRRLGLEGKPLTLAGKDFQGRPLGISNYRGKVVLVVFWTTWCRPCTEELPQLNQLHAKYQRAGFEVLGVNLDDPSAPIDAWLRRHKPRWNHLHDPKGMQGELAQQFGIISLPTMFLVDRQGKVLARSVSLEELKKSLPDILQGKSRGPGDNKTGAVPAAARRGDTQGRAAK